MKAKLLDIQCLTTTTAHHAFTSLARWRGRYYLASREAMTHNITPPGRIVIRTSNDGIVWTPGIAFSRDHADLRDPKLVATPDVLYCLLGAYLPSPHLQDIHGLSAYSGDNQLWSLWTMSRDGETWTPLLPLLRPNAWGWSAVVQHRVWTILSYDVGALEARNTITRWGGSPLTGFQHMGVIYDGGNLEREQGLFRYPATMPSEPVLYQPTLETLACCLRTETTMLLGVSRSGRPWRWEDTHRLLHPSAMMKTQHGWFLAARELTPVYTKFDTMRNRSVKTREIQRYDTSVVLYAVTGNRLEKALALQEKAGDCGYAGLCEGEKEGTILMSYYSAHEAPMPCSDVYMAQVGLRE